MSFRVAVVIVDVAGIGSSGAIRRTPHRFYLAVVWSCEHP